MCKLSCLKWYIGLTASLQKSFNVHVGKYSQLTQIPDIYILHSVHTIDIICYCTVFCSEPEVSVCVPVFTVACAWQECEQSKQCSCHSFCPSVTNLCGECDPSFLHGLHCSIDSFMELFKMTQLVLYPNTFTCFHHRLHLIFPWMLEIGRTIYFFWGGLSVSSLENIVVHVTKMCHQYRYSISTWHDSHCC